MTTWLKIGGSFVFSFFLLTSLDAAEIPFTILFTGDLHSSFEARPNTFQLGGMARLKTAFEKLKSDAKEKGFPVLQLDAGDCTEGSLFFNLGAGVASFEMLNRLGYQAVAVGNHDWYTGPTVLDKVLTRVPLNFSFLSANFNFRFLPEDNHLSEKIKRYEVFYLVDGEFLRKGDKGFTPQEGQKYFKVGVFGLSTNEAAYQFFFDPVRIQNPISEARKVVLQLRRTEKVDVVIALTHLLDEDDISIADNVTSIDLILGGHSHNKVIPDGEHRPVTIQRTEDDPLHDTTWLAKTGEFGSFMGHLDIVFDSIQNKMLWGKSQYELHPIDASYEENQEMKTQIDGYKQQLIKKYTSGDDEINLFSDAIAETEIELIKSGVTESFLGNLVVDAIYEKSKPLVVNFSFNNSEFLSHGLERGPISRSGIYNMLPLIYDPLKDTSWTIWTLDMDGATLKKAIDLVFMLGKFFDTAGLEVIYNPDSYPQKVVSIRYQGQEILDDRIYHVSATQGIVEALKLIKEELPGLSNMQDTHLELWTVLQDYFKSHSPIRADSKETARVTGRIRTTQPDLAILSENIVVKPLQDNLNKLEMTTLVQNLGYGDLLEEELPRAKTDPTELLFYYDTTPHNPVDDVDLFKPQTDLFSKRFRNWSPVLEEPPKNLMLIDKLLVPSLGKDQKISLSLKWDVSSLRQTAFPYTVYLLLKRASGTGFIVVPSLLEEDRNDRKLMKVDESNIYNNKAKTIVYLNQPNPQRRPLK